MQVNTLLIVESPTIERIITGFKIPGLDVASTAGYSWKPRPDFKNGKLTGIAGPDLLPFRNAIRAKSKNSGRIILATDSDPSGRFIATCLARDLPNKQLFRAYINLLSPRAVAMAVDTAVAWKSENVQPLINRLFVQKTFREESKNNWSGQHAGISPLLIHLALFPFFYGRSENRENGSYRIHRNSSSGRSGTYTYENSKENAGISSSTTYLLKHSEYYLKQSEGASQDIEKPLWKAGNSHMHYRIFRPWNTAVFISRYASLFQIGSGNRTHQKSFSEIQELLNRLFTSVPENLKSGLISYPRTTSDGFYRATWEQVHHHNLLTRNAEDLCPQVLWNVIPDDFPHEALRPIRMELSPPDVRPFLPKNLYEAYRIIHQKTSAVFMKPNAVQDDGHQSKSNPDFSIERLLQWLAQYALLPPSRFGSTLDNLIAGRWITATNGIAGPGPSMSGFDGLKARAESGELPGLIESLNKKIAESYNTSELVPDIRRMMKFTSEKTNA